MTIYTEEVTCAICGAPGLARPHDAAQFWLGAAPAHTDPAVCRDYLRRQRQQLDKLKSADAQLVAQQLARIASHALSMLRKADQPLPCAEIELREIKRAYPWVRGEGENDRQG